MTKPAEPTVVSDTPQGEPTGQICSGCGGEADNFDTATRRWFCLPCAIGCEIPPIPECAQAEIPPPESVVPTREKRLTASELPNEMVFAACRAFNAAAARNGYKYVVDQYVVREMLCAALGGIMKPEAEKVLSIEEAKATPCDWNGHRLLNHQWWDTADGYQRCANCKYIRQKPVSEKPLESERDQKAAIPEDLTRRYAELDAWTNGPVPEGMEMPCPASTREELNLIERIGRVEAERDQLRMERDAAWNEAIEAAVKACDDEHLNDPQDEEGDAAYEVAVFDCLNAVRSLARPIPAEPREGK